MSNHTLEAQVNQLESQWQKKSEGDYSLAEVLNDFTEKLQSDEKLLGWISARPSPFRIAIPLLLLTSQRLIICERHLLMVEIKSMPFESITSIDYGTKGIFGTTKYLSIREVARTTSFNYFTKEFCDKFFT